MSKLIAFGWYGGKYNHLDWLLPLLPETTHYIEAPAKTIHSTKQKRTEVLWVNYDVGDISQWQVEHKAHQKAFLALRQAAESLDL